MTRVAILLALGLAALPSCSGNAPDCPAGQHKQCDDYSPLPMVGFPACVCVPDAKAAERAGQIDSDDAGLDADGNAS